MKYKVGNKVIIQRGNYFNSEGKMDKWIGKTMTIKSINYNCYKMLEDVDEFHGTGWDWYEDMIKCLAPESQTVHIYVKGNETHALLKQDKQTIKESVARCNPADEFSLYEGAKLALDRLFDKEKVEVKKADKVGFKVGDKFITPYYVRIEEFKNNYRKVTNYENAIGEIVDMFSEGKMKIYHLKIDDFTAVATDEYLKTLKRA